MISKLKLRCGSQFTSKIEGMLTDLNIANDHHTLFEKFVKEKGIVLGALPPSAASSTSGSGSTAPVEFGVQVLTTGYWPTYKVYDVILPPVMNQCTKVTPPLPSLTSSSLPCLSLSSLLTLLSLFVSSAVLCLPPSLALSGSGVQ